MFRRSSLNQFSRGRLVSSLATFLVLNALGSAAGAAPAKDAGIQTVFAAKCLPCHAGGQTNRSGFDLATREALLRGGDNGPAVVSGKAQDSALWKRIAHEVQPGMPFQREKLSSEAIARIAAWIDAGAPYTAALKMDPSAITAVRA